MTRNTLLAISASVLAASAASAQRAELASFEPDDGMRSDRFGASLALLGNLAAVGAPNTDDHGSSTGSVYLFDITDPAAPVQLAKLLADDAYKFNHFGFSVAIGDGVLVVGALTDEVGNNSGSAYVFDISDPASPVQVAKIMAADGAEADNFGIAVALEGSVAIISAQGDDDRGGGSGSLYVFDLSDPASPVQVTKFTASDGQTGDALGYRVAMDGGVAIVSAHGDDDVSDQAGAAYLLDLTDPGNPVQIAKLHAPDGDSSDNFGASVAIGGGIAVVGASGDDDRGPSSGSAYVFDAATGQYLTKLVAFDGAQAYYFGDAVATDGTMAVVGSAYDAENGEESGSAYLFHVPGGQLVSKLLPSDALAFDRFGSAVAMHSSLALATSIGDARNSDLPGRGYLFETNPCPADLTGDGIVDILDVLMFLNLWAAQDPAADWNGDGSINSLDVLGFLDQWTSGC